MAIWHMAYVRGVYPRKKMFESNPLTTRARLRLLFADGRIRTCAGEAYLISKLSTENVEFNVQTMKKNASPPLKIIFFLFAMGRVTYMHEKSKFLRNSSVYGRILFARWPYIYSLLIYISSFLLLIVGCGTSVVLENSPKIILN